MKGSISLIICTYNPKREYLDRTLASIQAQTRRDFELIVVDNNSDQPVQELTSVGASGAKVVAEPTPGLTAARERGTRTATGELLIFADDDNILAPDFVERAAELFDNPTLGAVSGLIQPEYEVEPPSWFLPFESAIAVRRTLVKPLLLARELRYDPCFPIGAGMCIRRDIMLRYCDSLRTSARIEGRRGGALTSGEDIDMALFAISEGYEVGASDSLSVRHIIPARRMSEKYISDISRASARSAGLINAKWKRRAGGNVFEMFDRPMPHIVARLLVSGLLSFLPAFRIRARIAFALLTMKLTGAY